MLVQLLLSLLEVIVVFLFFVLLRLELLLDVVKLAVKGRPSLLAVLNEHTSCLVLNIYNRLLQIFVVLVDGLDKLLIDVGLILGLLTTVSLESLLVLARSRIDTHQQKGILIVFLYEFERPSGLAFNVLLDLFDSLPVLLLVHDVALLLKRHLILELESDLTLLFESFPCLPVLSLPVLSRHSSL